MTKNVILESEREYTMAEIEELFKHSDEDEAFYAQFEWVRPEDEEIRRKNGLICVVKPGSEAL